MSLRNQLVFAALVCSVAASAQIINLGIPDAFQVKYAANLGVGDSVINITNNGASSTTSGSTAGAFGGGSLCVSVYAFDPGEELLSCCTCTVTPNGLQSISVNNSLLNNTLTGEHPTSAVIKLVATSNVASCNAYTETTPASFAPGMRAWGTTLHALPTTPVTYGVTETAFSDSQLSQGEYNHLTSFCAFITPTSTNPGATNFGVCASCKTGGLGAATRL